jgi:hypothetical protein
MNLDELCTRKVSDVHQIIGFLGKKPRKKVMPWEVKENGRRASCPFP